jgi:hypothetical protein
MAFNDPKLRESLKQAWKLAPKQVRKVRLGNNKPLIRVCAKKFTARPHNTEANWSNGEAQAKIDAFNADMNERLDLENT